MTRPARRDGGSFPRRPVPVVMFDLDGTIVDHVGAATRAVAAWVVEAAPGVPAPPGLTDLWQSLEREHFGAYLAGRCSSREQRHRRLAALLVRLGLPVDEVSLDERFAAYLRHYEASWTSYPDVMDCLVALGCTPSTPGR